MAWPFNDTVREVARSIRNEPDRWRYLRDGFEMQRDDGITVWIANKRYGLDIRDSEFGRLLWGGVGALSSFYLNVNHHVLGSAVSAWRRATDAKRCAA